MLEPLYDVDSQYVRGRTWQKYIAEQEIFAHNYSEPPPLKISSQKDPYRARLMEVNMNIIYYQKHYDYFLGAWIYRPWWM